MKGLLVTQPFGAKLFTLFLLVLLGALLFTFLGIALAISAYGFSYEEIQDALVNFNKPGSVEVLRLVQGFATIGTFLLPALVAAHLYSLNAQAFLAVDRFPQPQWLVLLLMVGIAYSGGFLSDALYQLSTAINWPESLAWFSTYLEAGQADMNERYQVFLNMPNFLAFSKVLLVMALLPAVAEEAFFRGVLQPLLRQRLGAHGSVIVTALVFALLHQQALAFLSIFALGVILGYLREWSNSLWVPTITHFINNGSVVVLVYFFGLEYMNDSVGPQTLLILTMLVGLGVCLWLFKRFVKPASA